MGEHKFKEENLVETGQSFSPNTLISRWVVFTFLCTKVDWHFGLLVYVFVGDWRLHSAAKLETVFREGTYSWICLVGHFLWILPWQSPFFTTFWENMLVFSTGKHARLHGWTFHDPKISEIFWEELGWIHIPKAVLWYDAIGMNRWDDGIVNVISQSFDVEGLFPRIFWDG